MLKCEVSSAKVRNAKNRKADIVPVPVLNLLGELLGNLFTSVRNSLLSLLFRKLSVSEEDRGGDPFPLSASVLL